AGGARGEVTPRGSAAAVTTSAWPEAVQRVTSFLREARAEVGVEEFPEGTPTAEDAARGADCELGQIDRSRAFACAGGRVLVPGPGARGADSEKIARAAGSN